MILLPRLGGDISFTIVVLLLLILSLLLVFSLSLFSCYCFLIVVRVVVKLLDGITGDPLSDLEISIIDVVLNDVIIMYHVNVMVAYISNLTCGIILECF